MIHDSVYCSFRFLHSIDRRIFSLFRDDDVRSLNGSLVGWLESLESYFLLLRVDAGWLAGWLVRWFGDSTMMIVVVLVVVNGFKNSWGGLLLSVSMSFKQWIVNSSEEILIWFILWIYHRLALARFVYQHNGHSVILENFGFHIRHDCRHSCCHLALTDFAYALRNQVCRTPLFLIELKQLVLLSHSIELTSLFFTRDPGRLIIVDVQNSDLRSLLMGFKRVEKDDADGELIIRIENRKAPPRSAEK